MRLGKKIECGPLCPSGVNTGWPGKLSGEGRRKRNYKRGGGSVARRSIKKFCKGKKSRAACTETKIHEPRWKKTKGE